MTPAAPGAGGGTVEVTPATLDVTELAPGAVVAHDVSVANGSGVPVLVTVAHTASGDLFAGGSPLALASAWDAAGPACAGVPVVAAGASADLRLQVSLPAEAGNEYQGRTGAATITVTATELPGGVCADPGGDGTSPWSPVPGPGTPPASGVPGTPVPGAPGGTGSVGADGSAGAGAGTGAARAAQPDDALALTGVQAGLLLPTIAVLLAAGALLARVPRRRRTARPGAAEGSR